MSDRATITVIGAGVVGTNLATAFQRAGHTVRFAARDRSSAKVQAVVGALGVDVVELADAADRPGFVVLAVPFDAVASTAVAIGDLGDDVIVIDATNTVGASLPAGMTSTPDVIRANNRTATVVKAFNTIGAEAYLAPTIDDHDLFLPIAGEASAAEAVAALASDLGFDALVIGGDDAVSIVEAFAGLWIHLAFRTGLGRDFGFARLDR